MNAMLIVGGLFAIALLALVGIVFAMRSGPREGLKEEATPSQPQIISDATAEGSTKQQQEEQEEDEGGRSKGTQM